MLCNHCGNQMNENAKFCVACGYKTANGQRPVKASVMEGSTRNSQKTSKGPKKKRGMGCLVVLVIVLGIIGVVGYFAANVFGLLPPKNLGITYTEADFQSALAKIGTEIVFEGKSGDELRAYTKQLKKEGTKFSIDDFEWYHSDYQRKQFELTSQEATAFLNEIAPGFWWFENQQIKVLSDGTIEASGTGLLRKALNDLHPHLIGVIPIPIFERVNLYAKGRISINENNLYLNAESFSIGGIAAVSATDLNQNAHYFEALYKSVPGLVIHSLEVKDNGNIAVDALIPQKIEGRRRSNE